MDRRSAVRRRSQQIACAEGVVTGPTPARLTCAGGNSLTAWWFQAAARAAHCGTTRVSTPGIGYDATTGRAPVTNRRDGLFVRSASGAGNA